MKRVFTQQSLALALTLALCVPVSGTGLYEAQAKSLWNPAQWFSSDSNTKDSAAKVALQQAEQAQKEAEQALLEAQRAKERAQRARQAAEALSQKAQKPKTSKATDSQTAQSPMRPLEESPNTVSSNAESDSASQASEHSTPESAAQSSVSTTTKTATSAPKAPQTKQTAQTMNDEKGTVWNPVNWFKSDSSKPVVTEPKALSQKAAQAPATQTPVTETSKNGNAWNPMSWFGSDKPANTPVAKAESSVAASEPKANLALASDESLKSKAAIIETEKGNIAIEFYPEAAPQTVRNFTQLVSDGFYNKFNMKFHRVIPGFVIQTGDPTGTGAGGAKTSIPLEAKNKLSHNAKGVVAMARGTDPNSATSQFYITLAPQTALDGKYAIFGKVISGMDVLDKIEKGDMLYGVRLVEIDTVTRDPQPEKKNFFSTLF